jgi:hypothetical protein
MPHLLVLVFAAYAFVDGAFAIRERDQGHMNARLNDAMGGGSHMCAVRRSHRMSAFGGKADIRLLRVHVRF